MIDQFLVSESIGGSLVIDSNPVLENAFVAGDIGGSLLIDSNPVLARAAVEAESIDGDVIVTNNLSLGCV